jgi:hypothetical protein
LIVCGGGDGGFGSGLQNGIAHVSRLGHLGAGVGGAGWRPDSVLVRRLG